VERLFADDTSILVRGYNLKDSQNNMISTVNCLYKLFRIKSLSLNANKTNCIQFKTKNKPILYINIACNNYLIIALPNIKVLGIHINDSINWNCHIESIIPKLSSACYMMRSPLNTLEIIYHFYFNVIVSYVLYLGGNMPHSLKVFRKKEIIRVMIGCHNRASYRNLFRKLKILPLASQYILLFMPLVVNKKSFHFKFS
jgi:hypothetical protein